VGMASWIGLVRIVSTFGSQALAGYNHRHPDDRVRALAFLGNEQRRRHHGRPGAGSTGSRARASGPSGDACLYNLGFLSAIGLGFVVFARPIVSAFTNDPVVLDYGTDCLRIIAAGFPFYAYGMVLSQSFNGAGDNRHSDWLNLIVFWLWELPLAWVARALAGDGTSRRVSGGPPSRSRPWRSRPERSSAAGSGS